MTVLIDAFNLIYKFPELELFMYEDKLDEAKAGLFSLLLEVREKAGNPNYIVFVDGKKVKGDYETIQEEIQGMKIYYSQEQDADELIKSFIKENPRPGTLSLVTSDKKIIQFARQFKVRCITSEAYSNTIMQLLNNYRPDNPEEDKPEFNVQDLDEWMKAFSSNQSQTM